MSSELLKLNLDYIPTNIRDSFYGRYLEQKKENIGIADLNDVFSVLRRETTQNPIFFVGTGTCGLAAGAQKTIDTLRDRLQKRGVKAEIIEVGCIGMCFAEPLVDVKLPGKNRLCYQKITSDRVDDIIDKILDGNPPLENLLGQFEGDGNWENFPRLMDHPFLKGQKRRVLENCGVLNPISIDEYVANGGYSAFLRSIHSIQPKEVCDIVEKSGLRGRGGGGFPTGKKWKFALYADSHEKYMVCNADEGDPGAFMDRAVCEGDPHKLIEGLALASYAIGASKAYIYIRAEYPVAIKNLKIAIEQAKSYNLLGDNVLDSGFSLDVILKMGAGAFVCGEETALLHSIEGKRGMPRPRPPFPAVSGLFGKPTVINNVETLANIPPIISHGAEWFSSMGTASSAGTKVFALSGRVKRAGLVEIPMGTTVRDIIFNIGGGIEDDRKFKAVQIGGPSGGCVPEAHLDIAIDYESLKKVGAMIGSGGMVAMDERTCMVDVAKFFMDFIQRESCGKCIPCREGTRAVLDILKSITRGRAVEKNNNKALERFKGIMHLERLASVIQSTSLCGLGQTAPNPILSTLRHFRDEYEAHIFERRCPAGVCKELLSYHIDADLCRGCMICLKNCPAGCITGERQSPHHIDQDKCISCGACYTACPFGAITAS